MVVLSGIHNKEHGYYANQQQDRDAMQRKLLLLSPLFMYQTYDYYSAEHGYYQQDANQREL